MPKKRLYIIAANRYIASNQLLKVSIHSRYPRKSEIWFKCYTHGIDKDTNFAVGPGSTVIKYLTTSLEENRFYLEFSAPVNVDGYVMAHEEESA